MGLAALQHGGSSWTRDRTCVSCTGRWILLPLRCQGSPERDHFDMSRVGLSKVVKAMDILDPLRQVLDSRHAVQQSVPAFLASGFLCSAPVASKGAQTGSFQGLWPRFFWHFSACICFSLYLTLRHRGFSDGAKAESEGQFFISSFIMKTSRKK